MHRHRALILLVALLAVTGCGSGSDTDPEPEPKRDAPASKERSAAGSEPPQPSVSANVFVETAAIRTCLERADFVKRASPAGGIVAWRGPQGTIVVANEPQLDRVLGGLANARVVPDTNLVVSGDSPQLDAAVSCLRTPAP